LVNSSRELPQALAEEVEHNIKKFVIVPRPRKQAGVPPFKDKHVSRKVLKEIELWYESYLDP
jgi:hypothetical protein